MREGWLWRWGACSNSILVQLCKLGRSSEAMNQVFLFLNVFLKLCKRKKAVFVCFLKINKFLESNKERCCKWKLGFFFEKANGNSDAAREKVAVRAVRLYRRRTFIAGLSSWHFCRHWIICSSFFTIGSVWPWFHQCMTPTYFHDYS